ncbi:MAG: hypothetical protein JSR39_08805 [Verrucomicrobia bacterium]|nr:hypothetical protein [Verrucomicrobiota bacterium]
MEKFKIYVDRLKNGHVEEIKETVGPEFLEIEEEELSFPEDVQVSGEVYLADDHLVAHFSIQTSATLPCSICNEPVHIPINIQNAYSTIPLEEVRFAIYDLSNEIRETTLLQVPLFAECNNGKCPGRDQIKEFLHGDSGGELNPEQSPVVHFPFADLDM